MLRPYKRVSRRLRLRRGKSIGANRLHSLSATKAQVSQKRSSAAPMPAFTFLWPAALSPSTPPLPLRSSSTKPPASALPARSSKDGLFRPTALGPETVRLRRRTLPVVQSSLWGGAKEQDG